MCFNHGTDTPVMFRDEINIIGRQFILSLPYNLLFYSIIAILLTMFNLTVDGQPISFIQNFVFSQSVGCFCCLFSMAAHRLLGHRKIAILGFAVALTAGAIIGEIVACLILGINPFEFFQRVTFFFKILFGTLLFGSIIIYFWHTQERLMETRAMAQDERFRRLSGEKEMVETNLKLLQAQIEPHFLFNTLSNILSLLDTDLQKGKTMLTDLTGYLRTSLSKSRQEVSTLGQELSLIKGYLRIFKVRMGRRLKYRFEIPDDLRELPLAPMLVQPLVENAIKHGLEPKVGGGEIMIGAKRNGGGLRVEISDSGLGLQTSSEGGTGLANIRERLRSLYGDSGRLILEPNEPTGLKAIIEVPCGSGPTDNSSTATD